MLMRNKWLNHTLLSIACAGVVSTSLLSCKTDNTPDVGDIKLDVKAYDFHHDFYAIDTNDIVSGLDELKSKYPNFIHFYLDTIAVGLSNNPEARFNEESVKLFLTIPDYRNLIDTVNMVYKNTASITEDIVNTFKYIKYYDSSIVVPSNIYYVVTGLNDYVAVTRDDKDLCIGLDYFLGENFEPYFRTRKAAFQTIKFQQSMIPIWAATSIYNNNFFQEPYEKNLLALMIDQGKLQYFLALVVPHAKDYQRFGFTPEQMKWCNDNERLIYNFFTAKELLYSKQLSTVMRYVIDGPFSTGMPSESPGNTGSFIGYKIIKAYAENTGASWTEIIQEKDNQKIFKLAKYKP